MIPFSELSMLWRLMIILGLFLEVCAAGYLAVSAFPRMRASQRILLVGAVIACTIPMILYAAGTRADLRQLPIPDGTSWIYGKPVLLPAILMLAVGAYLAWLFREELRFRRECITRSSIKEGIDKISSGLCFYLEGGRVILSNSRMNALSNTIVGGNIRNAEAFWQTLSGGAVLPGVERLSYGAYPNFRLPDGTVWTFAREELEGFIQLTAADTTLQQNLTDELRDKNLELAALNLRLRKYGENVDELARAKERLETKIRIHGELGQALLAARRYLVDENAKEPPLDIWRRNIAMLRKEMEAKKAEDPLLILQKAADSAGVQLEIRGQLPEELEYRQFFLVAASEALTNAVFHAGAKTLRIELLESDSNWSMRFCNDGAKPVKTITEGGGLGSLRRKAESIGASMTMESSPEFALTITGRKR